MTWRISGDINGYGSVDINDLNRVADACGSTPHKSQWNEETDLNRDNIVDVLELFIVGKNYGQNH